MPSGAPGVCPHDGYVEEEPYDYDNQGNDLFECGQCGTIYAQDEEGKTTVVDNNGF